MIDIDTLEVLEKAATPGPWLLMDVALPENYHCFVGALIYKKGKTMLTKPDTIPDHELVVAMRNALPELFAEVRRLRRIEQAAKDAVIDFFSDGERLLLRADMARVQDGYPRYTRLWADEVKALFDAVHSRTE